jgi:hypothetical protein
MRYFLLFAFLLLCSGAFAQEQDTLRGVVIDKISKDRVASVNIVNITNGQSRYDGLKGQFGVAVHIGDVLVFSKTDYRNDTLKVKSLTSQIIYLVPTGRTLATVNIRDTIKTPQQQLLATQKEYNKIYGSISNTDLLSVGPGGAGVGIDALYNMISKSGRNAAHLRETIERDYHQNVIDYRFNRVLVAKVTGLKDAQLTDFMQKYRPGYFFVTTATDYEFIASIKSNYKRYQRRPRAYTLPRLKADSVSRRL